MKLLNEEIAIKPLSDFKVHVKLESLLKPAPEINPAKVQSRIIVWLRYAIAALYSPIFLEIKKRLV